MIRYSELVKYIKDNHVSWNIDLFDVLKNFFEEYYRQDYSHPPSSPFPSPTPPIEDTVIFQRKEFKEPDRGEYSTQDVLDLFST